LRNNIFLTSNKRRTSEKLLGLKIMNLENSNKSIMNDVEDRVAVDDYTNGSEQPEQTNANRDPLSGEIGSHPLGTGVGAAGAGTIATVAGGAVGGPIGAVVGAVIGSVVGGLAGKDAAEQLNPTFEDIHWREIYSSGPYVEKGTTYSDYQTAYRTGYEGYDRYGHSGRSYSDIESDLQRDYEGDQSGSLPWETAKHAVRDAWERASASFRN
jgi:hypothetical protein